eukprot:gene457-449_t
MTNTTNMNKKLVIVAGLTANVCLVGCNDSSTPAPECTGDQCCVNVDFENYYYDESCHYCVNEIDDTSLPDDIKVAFEQCGGVVPPDPAPPKPPAPRKPKMLECHGEQCGLDNEWTCIKVQDGLDIPVDVAKVEHCFKPPKPDDWADDNFIWDDTALIRQWFPDNFIELDSIGIYVKGPNKDGSFGNADMIDSKDIIKD